MNRLLILLALLFLTTSAWDRRCRLHMDCQRLEYCERPINELFGVCRINPVKPACPKGCRFGYKCQGGGCVKM